MKAYCGKIIANAKSKKSTEPKFKHDPDTKWHRILNTLVEG